MALRPGGRSVIVAHSQIRIQIQAIMKTQAGYSSSQSVHINSSRLARATRVLSLAVLGLLPLAAAAQPACVSPPSGLVSWWRAEGNALDEAGTNNGTLVGNTTYGPGRVGQAFVLDGSGDGVSVGNPPNLQLQNFTIEAWVKRAS